MRPVIGLDFGTTNSAIAVADAGKEATLACFGDGSDTITSFRSILYFPHKDRSSTVKAETKAGPEAISSYLEDSDIGSVFLTGGSSFVPYVRRFFARTFGTHKLKGGEELTTVAKGLALRALENG